MKGKEIKDLRESLDYNQDEFAEKLGVTRDTVAKYENESIRPREEIRKIIEGMMEPTPAPFGAAHRRMQASIITNVTLMRMFSSLDVEDRVKIFEMVKSIYEQAHKGVLKVVPE